MKIVPNSKPVEGSIARGCRVEDRLGPLTDSCDYEPLRRSSFALDALAKMQIRESTQNHPSYHKSNKIGDFQQPQSLYIELNPDMYQKEVDVTGPDGGHPQTESKGEEPAQTDAWEDVLATPGQLPKSTVVRSNSPSPDDESEGREISPNLGSTKGCNWEPDRSKPLEGKHYSWAATEASDNRYRGNEYPRGEGYRYPGTNYGDDRNPQGRPDPIPPEIPMHTAGAPSPFDGMPPRTLTPSFRPLPGDIVITLECRPIRQNNPYFTPGGHCYFYTDPMWVDGGRQMTRRAQAQELSGTRTQFDAEDLIVRTGQMDHAFHWIPQRNVEVFRYIGPNNQGPGSWLLYNSVPNRPVRPPLTYAAGDPALAHRTVHEFLPANAWADRVIFSPERGDIILCEEVGFRNVGVWFFEPRDRSTTEIECAVVLVRAGYGRIGDSLVATVEMYQKKPNPATGELGWVFQGRDIQIYGGTMALDSLIQMMDPIAGSAPRDRFTAEETAETDSYLNL